MSKEQIYDEQISPLMQQIIEICKEHEIPVFADFQFGNCDFVTTNVSKNGHFVYDFYSAVSQCKMSNNGMNVDKLIGWLMKHPNKSSAYLHLLGNKAY
jgi:hypothetical protein